MVLHTVAFHSVCLPEPRKEASAGHAPHVAVVPMMKEEVKGSVRIKGCFQPPACLISPPPVPPTKAIPSRSRHATTHDTRHIGCRFVRVFTRTPTCSRNCSGKRQTLTEGKQWGGGE